VQGRVTSERAARSPARLLPEEEVLPRGELCQDARDGVT
jgi:hypothetical protein